MVYKWLVVVVVIGIEQNGLVVDVVVVAIAYRVRRSVEDEFPGRLAPAGACERLFRALLTSRLPTDPLFVAALTASSTPWTSGSRPLV
ncbi:hypothetical protein BGZ80_007940, partial [Entomortierella chlamydospora]